MKTNLVRNTIMGLAVAAILAVPALTRAQDASSSTNAPSTSEPAPTKKKKHDTLPFHGKVEALDTNAMTLTVGQLVIQVTSDTKITKDGKPATLSEGTVGENVGGAYKKDASGKLNATTVHFGIKSKKSAGDAAAPSAPPTAPN